MERRRRALGVRKPVSNTEVEKPTKLKPTAAKGRRHKADTASANENISEKGKEAQSDQKGSSTQNQSTPNHHTPKHQSNGLSLKEESPSSPSIQLNILPRTFGSPEVEVSWDWSCSQVPRDLLPPRRTKRASHNFSQPSVSSSIVPLVAPCPRLPLNKQMSEEENQERLAFYKNVLSNSMKCNTEERALDDSKNNNIEKNTVSVLTNMTTPKRQLKPQGELVREKEQTNVNEFFDDSANEFMLECSQAIEEKLKNGEIDMGPIVEIKITNKKHAHSPVLQEENSHKKMCHARTKLNLFPEDPFGLNTEVKCARNPTKRHLSLKSPHRKQLKNVQNLESKMTPQGETEKAVENDDDILFMMPTQPNHYSPLNKITPTANSENDSDIYPENCEINERMVTNNRIKPHYIDNKLTMPNNLTCNAVRNPNKQFLEMRAPQKTQGVPSSRSYNTSAQNVVSERFSQSVNIPNCISVDKFPKAPYTKPFNSVSNVDKNFIKPQTGCKSVIKPLTVSNPVHKQQSVGINKAKEIKSGQENMRNFAQDTKSEAADLTFLLDDGFDVELSSLDFDSLCCSSQPKEPDVPPVTNAMPKICSQQEIEARRLAALNRLMMKKRRR